MYESKVGNVEEDQAYITSIKNNGDTVNAYITSIKIRITPSTNLRNQGLLQCLIDLIKLHNWKKYQTRQKK